MLINTVWQFVRHALMLGEERCAVCFCPYFPKEDGFLCKSCTHIIYNDSIKRCEKCGKEILPDAINCIECISDAPWRRCFVMGSYKGVVRDCILRGKFGADITLLWKLGLLFGKILKSQFKEMKSTTHPCLIPIPLHTTRLRSRGYNQSLELARGISESSGFELFDHAIIRTRNSPTQRSLSKAKRMANVEGIFDVSQPLNGLDVILVDDVITTGSTLASATRTLLASGVRRVDLAVIGVDE